MTGTKMIVIAGLLALQGCAAGSIAGTDDEGGFLIH